MSKHFLKLSPKFYVPVERNTKPFEVRKNDRDYKVGDILVLGEYSEGEYTGRSMSRKITYILDDNEYCKEGYVILGIAPLS